MNRSFDFASERPWRRTRPYAVVSGALLAVCTLPIAVAQWVHGDLDVMAPSWAVLTAGLATCSLFLAATTLPRRPRVGRVLATIGLLTLAELAAHYLLTTPFLALAVLLALTGGLAGLWNVGGPLVGRYPRRGRLLEGQARGAAVATLLFWLLTALASQEHSTPELLAMTFSLLVVAGYGVQWAIRARTEYPIHALILLLSLLLSSALAAVFWSDWWAKVSSGMVLTLTMALVVPTPRRAEMGLTSWWEPLLGHPERLFVGTFATLSAAGTLLLALPQSAAAGLSVGLLDAAFTAVSAVCVTGLIVLDTPLAFSPLGQVGILMLIQLGGLGIMTFSTAVLRVLGRRMSLRHEGAVASLISPQDRGRLFGSAQRIIVFTFSVEAIGALLLFIAFLGHGDHIGQELWRAVFTSVSAFCNAGFALQSANLVPYQGDAFILHVVAVLIITGGLSPVTVVAVPLLLQRPARPVSAQAKLSLATTAILLLIGFVLILTFEWGNTLRHLSILDRIHNAWFQSVTLRTAGFNSVDITTVRPSTLLLMILWMFIGGSPGGTAGGIKTTTAAILVLSVVNAVRGYWSITVFARRITERTFYKAVVIATLGFATVLLAVMAMQLTQAMPTRDVIFEVVSALGTVGLSVGGTEQLDDVGKVIISACMFVGRVGPLTLLMFLSQRTAPRVLGRPEEEIDVG